MWTKKNFVVLFICLFMTLSLMTACDNAASPGKATGSGTEAPKEYKLGFFAALTGDTALWGTRSKEAAELAAERINASGGINGAKLVIEYQDTASKKEEAANIVQRYVSDPSILGVFGTPVSSDMFVIGPIAEQAGVMAVGTGTTAVGIPELGDYVFRVATTTAVGAPAVMTYLHQEYDIKNVAFLYSMNNNNCVSAYNEFVNRAEELGIKTVAVETYNDGDTNYSAQISKIVKANPDALIISGYSTEACLAVIEAKKQGLDVPIAGNDGIGDTEVMKKIGGESANGMITFQGFCVEYDASIAKEFTEDFIEKYGHEPEAAAANSYDAVMMMAEALKKSGPDRKAFRDAFAEIKNFEGVSGKISFDENGECSTSTFVLEYRDGQYHLLKVI